MKLKRFIVHEIVKEKNSKDANFTPTNEEVDVSEKEVIRLASELHFHIHSSRQKVYGKFLNETEPQNSSYFTQEFFQYANNKNQDNFDLIKLTSDVSGGSSTGTLKKIMENIPQSTGGYILFIDYMDNDIDYFTICMLNNQYGRVIKISKGKAKVSQAHMLNLKDLDIACRIEKNKIHQITEAPLVFITAKKTNHYFANFIGCTDFLTADDNSKALAGLLERIIVEMEVSDDDKDNYRQSAKSYIDICATDRNEVLDVYDLSAHIFGENERELVMQKANEYKFKLDPFFSPKKTRFDILTRLSLIGDWVDMKLNRSNLRRELFTFPDDNSVQIHDAGLARRIREQMPESEDVDE